MFCIKKSVFPLYHRTGILLWTTLFLAYSLIIYTNFRFISSVLGKLSDVYTQIASVATIIKPAATFAKTSQNSKGKFQVQNIQ